MKVVICGAGQVGLGIAKRLAAEGNDISIIESQAELVQQVNDMLEVRAVHGHGAHPDALEQAGAPDADMLIAVTRSDEVNIVACEVGHSLFNVPTKIARVRAQSYLAHKWSKLFTPGNMAIDYTISPEIEVGDMVLRRLEVPGAFETVSFGGRRVSAIGIHCGADCPVVDTPIHQLSGLFPDLPAVIVAVIRDGRLFLPHGGHQLQVGDDIYVVTPTDQVGRTLVIFGHEEPQARRIVIAGGGNIGLYVAQGLEARDANLRIKVIEVNRARAIEIADKLQRTVVLHGSALAEDLLREAEVQAADTIVAVTNDDRANILTSVLAKHLGCKRALCLVNSSGYHGMTLSLGLEAPLDPRAVTVSRILQYVRRGRIRGVHSVHEGAGEFIEVEAPETAPVVGKSIKDLGLSDGVRFGAVLRNGKIVTPTGSTELEANDRAILFARTDYVREVEQMFRVSPDYF